MRTIARIMDVSPNTVTKLLRDAGEACQYLHDDFVYDVQSTKIQCDEIWSFNYAKDKNVPQAWAPPGVVGSVWTWTALDPDAKFIVTWHSGERTLSEGKKLIFDLHGRLANRVQITTGGLSAYIDAVELAFGREVDYGQFVKGWQGGDVDTVDTLKVAGRHRKKHMSTSLVERQNLTMRLSMRRFTRRTNAHSKSFEQHCNALALYFVWYNSCRPHSSLGTFTTPAMAVGLAHDQLTLEWIIDMVDARNPVPKRRGPYKKRKVA